MKEITKTDLSVKMNISRPTLDKYLKEGFPPNMTNRFKNNICEDKGYRKLLLENEIRLYKYQISKLEKEIEDLDKEDNRDDK